MDSSGEFSMGQQSLSQGLTQVRNPLESVHPVQTSEKNYLKNRELAEMAQLRKMQGIHAPIRFGRHGKLQSTLGFETLDKAAALGLETATPLTDPRQYINSNLGFSNLKI